MLPYNLAGYTVYPVAEDSNLPPVSLQLSGNRKLTFMTRKIWKGVQKLTLSWQEVWD